MRIDCKLQATLDHVDAPVFILERSETNEPVYTAINKAIRERINLSLDECLGKTARQIYQGQFGELAYKYHCECLAGAKKITYDLTLHLNGEDIHTRTTLSPVLDNENRLTRIIGTANIVNAEYYIEEANKKALIRNAENEQLLNLTAHDLRSPMRNMKVLTKLLREDFVDLGDGKLELVDMLQKLSTDTIELIGNIIDFAQTSQATKTEKEFQLAPICRKILSVLDPQNKNTLHISDARIYGDRTATEIAIRNLIDNAFKHNIDTSVHINVLAMPSSAGFFQVQVSDNGCGMEDPSTLIKEKMPHKIDGSYGLYGVSRLLNARGGSLVSSTTSSGGKGVEVTFELPGRIISADNASTHHKR